MFEWSCYFIFLFW